MDARNNVEGMGHISGRKSEIQKLGEPHLLERAASSQLQATSQRWASNREDMRTNSVIACENKLD